jgi:hypothetical protein
MPRTAFAAWLLFVAGGLCGSARSDEIPVRPAAAARLSNAGEVRKRLALAPEYDGVRGVESLKIAVLDYGFEGVGEGRRYLPENAVVVDQYDAEFIRRFGLGDPEFHKPLDPANRHGREMAQIVWGVTGSDPRGPQFYLLNANGPTMLRRAVRYAIEQKVDLILFSGAFEGGGNGDGRGPVNRIVGEAVAAGIIWVNAAGNYGRHVYNGPVRIDRDGYLRFREGVDGTSLRFRNRLDENMVTVTLTWNDYREQEDAGTAKDLDLYVEDWLGRRVGASELTQVTGDRTAADGESRNPRERIMVRDLPANVDYNYRIRIRARTNDFTPDDRIRVLVTASRETYLDPATGRLEDGFRFLDATGKGELYPPADHPLVLTVGDSSPASAVGPTADHRVKPDVVLEDSRAFFTDGETSAGSSNAAAYFAGVVAVLRAAEPGLTTRHLLRLARQGAISQTATARRPAAPEMTRSADRAAAPPFRDTRYDAPPAGSSTPASRSLVVTLGSRRFIITGTPRRSASGESATASQSQPYTPDRPEVIPPPQANPNTADPAPFTRSRSWRTPSRAHLAEVVQGRNR